MNTRKIDSSLQQPLVDENETTEGETSIINQAESVESQSDINPDYETRDETVITNYGCVESSTLTEAVNLAWEGINVFVDKGKRTCFGRQASEGEVFHILKDVSGEIGAGSLVALMGSSGAGKSTLLNVLSYRNISNVNVSGAVFVNGKPVSSEINNMSAYVQQEDLFIGTLTVREHLMFQAVLRMEKRIPLKERIRRVEKIIAELGLTKCSNTMIGTPGRVRGISGGEKKRLSFASEILTDPPLLFVDEPTSGLDSFMAQAVVATLQKLTKRGKTVLATIHQPSSEVYLMFDNIILLAEGRVAYSGSRENALPYFDSIGYPCPPNYNPADHFIQVLSVIPEKEEESMERMKFICDKHQESEESPVAKTERKLQRVNSFGREMIYRPRYQAGWWKQFRVLFYRSILNAKRDKMVSVIRIMQSFFLGIVVGLMYLRLAYDQENIRNFSGLIFFMVTQFSFTSLQGVIFVFPVEVPVFLREHKNGMYRTDTYFLAKTIAEIPVFSISAVLFLSITYWMAGLRENAEAFFIAVGIAVLIVNTGASYGYVISTLSSSIETATAIGPVLMLPLLLFGGFFINNNTVPDYFIWLRYLSWFNYAYEDLMVNQWDGYTGKIGNQTGDDILHQFQLKADHFNTNLYCIVALLCGFRILAFLLLLRRAAKHQ